MCEIIIIIVLNIMIIIFLISQKLGLVVPKQQKIKLSLLYVIFRSIPFSLHLRNVALI